MDRQPFFAAVRRSLFDGVLSQRQVDGIGLILDEWERAALSDRRHLAYMLATAYHEVDRTMQPIKEYGSPQYFFRMYDIEGTRPSVARALGNLYSGDGARFSGRGLVQLTGRKNYQRMSELVTLARWQVDLTQDPDQALRSDIAVAVLFEGMLKAESSFGDFTGLALEDFFNDHMDDPVGARRIINGLDQAEKIAGYHRQFLAALT